MRILTQFLFLLLFCVTAYAQAPLVFKEFDLNVGSSDSEPLNFNVVNGKLLFSANTSVGRELWISDGTTAGTKLLKDINAGAGSSLQNAGNGPRAVLGSKLVFAADNGTTGEELWVSDGTAAGTTLLKDIYTGSNSSNPLADGWAIVGSKLIFSARTLTNGNEVWVTDGTTAGTTLLKDINSGGATSYPGAFVQYNGKVYFGADDGVNGVKLWVTDGTASGTQLINVPFEAPVYFVVLNSMMISFAYDATNGVELWKTDGTVGGSSLIKDINPGFGSSVPASLRADMFCVYNNKLYFVADNGSNGYELWVTDGTTTGTQMVKEIRTGTGDAYIGNMMVFNNKLYFGGMDASGNRKLWETDGTAGGTKIAVNTNGVFNEMSSIIGYKKSLYFNATDNAAFPFSDDLFKSNGTTSGTTKIGPSTKTDAASNIAQFIMYDSTLYFCANYNNGYELWSMKDTTGSGGGGSSNVEYVDNERVITFYPNPVHDKITIKITKSYNKGSVALYDITGRLVMPVLPVSGSQPIVPVKDVVKGIYTIGVMLDGKEHKQKLVIE
ncbi:MAG: T9SS type A sorting domain-containing protein [Flavipsychrobacter sp.]|nr:T9SS type A sorting domain-containing protein [Flavipsychrobacter sp.]